MQLSFGDAEGPRCRKRTRRKVFLAEMDQGEVTDQASNQGSQSPRSTTEAEHA